MEDEREERRMAVREDMGMALVQSFSAQEIIARKQLVKEVMDNVMLKDVHYGIIPGTKKNTLYKPGGECLASTFMLAPRDRVIRDGWEDGERVIQVATALFGPGEVFLGEGIGECTSAEEKYAWRDVKVAEEYDATPPDRRRLKWTKDRDKRTGEPIVAKQVRQNAREQGNTLLKMAKKRSFLDAVITVTGCSDIFDVDLEDLSADQLHGGDAREARAAAKPKGGVPSQFVVQQPESATPDQQNEVWRLAGLLSIEPDALKARFAELYGGTGEPSHLTFKQAQDACQKLNAALGAR